jgi:hypothetical protein
MRRQVLPAGLVVAAALADAGALHEAAFYLLVAAVPVTAVGALSALGDLLDGSEGRLGRLQVALSGLALVWVVLAAAVRSPSVDEGTVPPLAISALVASLAVFAVQGLAALIVLEPAGEPRESA